MENYLRSEVRYVNFDRKSTAQTYLTTARRLCAGVEALARVNAGHELASRLLAAHALESALKAYLSGIGFTINRLTHAPFGHDLEKLWIEVATRGLAVPARPPQWCSALNREHGLDFSLRQPGDRHDAQIPGLGMLARNLAELVAIVGRAI